jgi:hypothetical protein
MTLSLRESNVDKPTRMGSNGELRPICRPYLLLCRPRLSPRTLFSVDFLPAGTGFVKNLADAFIDCGEEASTDLADL